MADLGAPPLRSALNSIAEDPCTLRVSIRSLPQA